MRGLNFKYFVVGRKGNIGIAVGPIPASDVEALEIDKLSYLAKKLNERVSFSFEIVKKPAIRILSKDKRGYIGVEMRISPKGITFHEAVHELKAAGFEEGVWKFVV